MIFFEDAPNPSETPLELVSHLPKHNLREDS